MELLSRNNKLNKKFIVQIKDAIDRFGMETKVNTIIECEKAIKDVAFKCYATNKLLGMKECFKETVCGIEATASYVNDDIRTSLSIPTACVMIDFDFKIKDIFNQELAILDSVKIQTDFDFSNVISTINAGIDPDIYRRDLFINDILGHVFVPLNIFSVIVKNEKNVEEVPYIAGFLSDGKRCIVHSVRASYCGKRLKRIDLGGIDSVTMQIIKYKKRNWDSLDTIESAINRVTKFYITTLNINTWEYIDTLKKVRFSDECMREYYLKYEALKLVDFIN